MSAELKRLLAASLLSALAGALTTFALVWRDMAVVKAELAHIREDVSLIQTFVAEDNKAAWMAAKARIREDRTKGHDE